MVETGFLANYTVCVSLAHKQSLSPFCLVVFVVLAQSVSAMTINRSCVLAGHG